MRKVEKTKMVYGFLWEKADKNVIPTYYHFNDIQGLIPEPIVRGRVGIDVGSGCGYDTYIMAKANPRINIISMDISDGVYKTKELTTRLDNVKIIKSSISQIPIKDNIFDFAYSFGVLHHIPNPKNGLLEITRVLKKDSPVFLYLYENHADNIIKYAAVKIITCLRKITVNIPPRVFYVFCWFLSPFIYIIFSLPAGILRKFKITKYISDKIPFNFGTGIFSLRGDLYDRLMTPIEHRFNKQEVYDMFRECGFQHINISKLKDRAGWIIWGYKK